MSRVPYEQPSTALGEPLSFAREKPVRFNADGHGVGAANPHGLVSFRNSPGAFLDLPEIDPSAELHVPKGLIPILDLPVRADLEISLHRNEPTEPPSDRTTRGLGRYFSECLDLGPVLTEDQVDKISVSFADQRVKVAQKRMAKNHHRAIPNASELLLTSMAEARFCGKLAAFNIEARRLTASKG